MAWDVFKKLRLKLTASILIVLSIILILIIGSFNLYLHYINMQSYDVFFENILQNNGKPFHMEWDSFKPSFKPDLKPDEMEKFNVENKNPEENGLNDDFNFRNQKEMSGNNPEMPQMDFHNNEINMVPPPEKLRDERTIKFPFFLKRDAPGFRNYCCARIDSNKKLISIESHFFDNTDEETENELLNHVLSFNKIKGIYQNYIYLISPDENRDNNLIILLDITNEIAQEQLFAIVSVIILLCSIFAAFFISWIFARWTVTPVQEAFIKQKQFIADASHELKTPIAVIGANIDVLAQELPGNKWLEYIKTENARMGNLVKDMLYLAREDAGRTVLDKKPFNIIDACACSVLPFECVAFEQGKKLEIDLPKEPIEINGDESKIKQIFVILTDNALKNTDSGDTIKITGGKDGNKCFISVYNTGNGISSDDMKKIFNRFYRVDSSRARKTGGYGLGLPIAQSIANSHYGKITVESEVGSYAKFSLILPC